MKEKRERGKQTSLCSFNFYLRPCLAKAKFIVTFFANIFFNYFFTLYISNYYFYFFTKENSKKCNSINLQFRDKKKSKKNVGVDSFFFVLKRCGQLISVIIIDAYYFW